MSVTISYPSTQFEELYGPFVNLGAHLHPKGNSPFKLNNKTIFKNKLRIEIAPNKSCTHDEEHLHMGLPIEPVTVAHVDMINCCWKTAHPKSTKHFHPKSIKPNNWRRILSYWYICCYKITKIIEKVEIIPKAQININNLWRHPTMFLMVNGHLWTHVSSHYDFTFFFVSRIMILHIFFF